MPEHKLTLFQDQAEQAVRAVLHNHDITPSRDETRMPLHSGGPELGPVRIVESPLLRVIIGPERANFIGPDVDRSIERSAYPSDSIAVDRLFLAIHRYLRIRGHANEASRSVPDSEPLFDVEVTAEEAQALYDVGPPPRIDAQLSAVMKTGGVLGMTEDEAIDLREDVADQYAIIGTNADYSPNDVGRVLESLVDKLFEPGEG